MGQPGVKEIAARAGCSPSTVSRVLSGRKCKIAISDRTRDKILEICRELDYNPSIHASRFFTGKSKTLGIVTPASFGLDDESFARFLSGAYMRANSLGYRVLPLMADEKFISSGEFLNLFKRKEIDGMIIWGASRDGSGWIERLHADAFPVVLSGNMKEGIPSVTSDDFQGSSAMAARCVGRGARKFVYVDIALCETGARRKAGFMSAAAGFEAHVIESGGFDVRHGEAVAGAVFDLRPDAVVCGNDKIAIGVMEGLARRGLRAPENALITGADNIEMSEHCLAPLTTYDPKARETGAKSVEILASHLETGAALESAAVAPDIHIRASA
jgi:LacI family transcriptional regulator